jgi:heterotetrameric sarcosine oxidase gamma subunit
LRWLAPEGLVVLRGRGGDRPFLDAAVLLLGYGLPLTPNTIIADESTRTAWLGPSAWLARLPMARVAEFVAHGERGFAGLDARAIDVSGSKAILSVRGGDELFAAACSLDRRRLGPARCAQTLFAGISALIAIHDDDLGYDVVVDAALRIYLEEWLAARA